jgi:valyl-tRNA synthetase
VTQTALADDEVEMEEVDGHFYYLKYPLKGTGDARGSRRHDASRERCSATPPSR